MKNKLSLALIACALLTTTANVDATPKCAGCHTAHVYVLGQNKDTRILMICELTDTKEGRQEMARMLEHADENEFRSYYETYTVNPG